MSEQNKPEDEKSEKGKKAPEGGKQPEEKPAPGKGAKAPDKGRETPEKAAKAPQPEQPARSKRTDGRRNGGRGLAVVAVLIAIAAGAGAGYMWQELQKTRAGVDAMQGALGERIDHLQAARDRLAEQMESQQGVVEQLNQNLQSAERERDALSQAMRHLRTRLSQDRTGWILAEVEYLLTVANQNLRLERSVSTSIAALEAADQRLAQQADPALIPVREAIADELQQLRSVTTPDISGVAARLGSLLGSVDNLPLTGETRAPVGGEEVGAGGEPPRPTGWSDWRGWLSAVWAELKGLVTVRHTEEVGRPLMSPEQQYFLRQNLSLKLETARAALLENEPAVYQDAINEAGRWVSEYFQTETGATRGFQQTLDELARVNLQPELPDISGSLRTLRRTMDELAQQSPAPAATGEEAAQ